MKVYCVFEEPLGYGDHDLLCVFDSLDKAKNFIDETLTATSKYCIEVKDVY